MDTILGTITVVVCALIYFAPSIIAFKTNIENKVTIVIFNVLFGWTMIGYFILLFCVMKAKNVNDKFDITK